MEIISRPRSRYGQKHREYKKSQYDDAYMLLSNTEATIEAQFMRKLSNIEAELE